MAHHFSAGLVAVVTPPEPLLLAIVGPTASGKSALAVSLAERFHGEVVSCDSVAVYREMEIGTAKPSREERERVPHHMLDVVTPDEDYSAGDYARDARAAIAGITARGRMPIVSGGTGLYLRALLEGLFPAPQRDTALRAELVAEATEHGAESLHRRLAGVDGVAAARIHPNDAPKLIRALEVCVAAQQPMTEAWQQGRDALRGYRVVRIGLDPPRGELYERINARAARMFADGLVEETRILQEKYGEGCRALGSLGYRQAGALLRGEMSEGGAIAATAQGHRNYAKRQMTWFRREQEVRWLYGFGMEQLAQAERLTALIVKSFA